MSESEHDSKHPWPLNILEQEWPNVKRCWLSFALCVLAVSLVLCGGSYWLVDHLYAAELKAKDATLTQKDAIIATIANERDKANRDNDKLHLRLSSSQD